MAWVEGKVWEMEQGVDGRRELNLWANSARTQPFPFIGWSLHGSVSDAKRREVYPLDLSESDPAAGIIVMILPEAMVNSLKVGKEWFYNILGVAPGAEPADDSHIAFGPVVPTFRPARRVA